MPALDVVRGLAIVMVVVYHGLAPHGWVFVATQHPWLQQFFETQEIGLAGVLLFFVLSGFLITGILVDSRETTDYFRNFYWRRVLRIVPAYLMMLVVLKLAGHVTWGFFAVALLYLCNVSGMFGVGHEYGPLWSLSVEEQFYLVWPLLVRKVSRKHLEAVCVALVALTPVLRFALLYGPPATQDIQFKTWALMDFFAAGALLALGLRSRRLHGVVMRSGKVLLAGGALLLMLRWTTYAGRGVAMQRMAKALREEPWLLIGAGLVLLAVERPGVAKMWVAQILIFFAKISYGLYLCHQFLFYVVDARWHLNPAGSIGLLPQLLLRFGAEALLAVVVATVSRYTVEEFFLRLKPKHERVALGYSAATKIT
jgi:peptidoglycan/LPS O-acetylase OafA/YrhL